MNDIWFCIWSWCDAYTKNKCTMVNMDLRGLARAYDRHCENQQLFLPQVPIHYASYTKIRNMREICYVLLPDGTHQILPEPDLSEDLYAFTAYASPRRRRLMFFVCSRDDQHTYFYFRSTFINLAPGVKVFASYQHALQISIQWEGTQHHQGAICCTIMKFKEPIALDACATIVSTQSVTTTFPILSPYASYFILMTIAEFISRTELFVLFTYCVPPGASIAPTLYAAHFVCINGIWTCKSCEPYTHTYAQDTPVMNDPTYYYVCREDGNTNELTGTYIWALPDTDLNLPRHLVCYKLDTLSHTLVRAPQCVEYVYKPKTRLATPMRRILVDDDDICLLCHSVAMRTNTDNIVYTLICTGLRSNAAQVEFVRYLSFATAQPHGYNAWRRTYDGSIMLACYNRGDTHVDIYNLTTGSAPMARLINFAQPMPTNPLPSADPVEEPTMLLPAYELPE